ARHTGTTAPLTFAFARPLGWAELIEFGSAHRLPSLTLAERQRRSSHHPGRSETGTSEHGGQIRRRHPWIRREPVDLRFVQQQEHRPGPTYAVLLVRAVQPSLGHALLVQLRDPFVGAGEQVLVVPELDGLGGARLCARGLLALGEPVVAQGALLGDPGLAVRPSAIAVQCFCLRRALAGGGGA